MDGVDRKFLDWRASEHREIVRESHHTKELPPEIVARIEALETFATQTSDLVNQANADILEARKDLMTLQARLNAAEQALASKASLNHFHDYQAERVA